MTTTDATKAETAERIPLLDGWYFEHNGMTQPHRRYWLNHPERGALFHIDTQHCEPEFQEFIAALASKAAAPGAAELTKAARDVLTERRRQVDTEGWSPNRDDEYCNGDLAQAAVTYIVHNYALPAREPEPVKFQAVAEAAKIAEANMGTFRAAAKQYHARKVADNPELGRPRWWPWPIKWWKPTTTRRDLVKAAALILAEIERLDRATLARPAAAGSEGDAEVVRVADAIEACDWSGAPIGNKMILRKAVEVLRRLAERRPAPGGDAVAVHEELRKLSEAATKGRFYYAKTSLTLRADQHKGNGPALFVAPDEGTLSTNQDEINGRFIAAAVNYVRAALAQADTTAALSAARPAPVCTDSAKAVTELSKKHDWCPTCGRGWSWVDGNVHRAALSAARQAGETGHVIKDAEKRGMLQGMLLACTTAIRSCFRDEVAERIMDEAGITAEEIRNSGLDEFDTEPALRVLAGRSPPPASADTREG